MSHQEISSHRASDKFESSQVHAKKAFDATTTAAKEVADTAQSAFREGKKELSAAAKDLSHAARATYSSLAEQTATIGQEYCEKACELEAVVTDYVREKPLHSIGIAFGVGLFFGILLSKR
ncbi:MAG: hypothetical protein K2W99_01850 [Chthoniobacterales bacterium]|nr:hypothetical protein [Chthoniobacterales bacterium]